MEERFTCCICGEEFTGWGNNPAPVVNADGERCCNDCNANVVIPARLVELFGRGKDE